MNIAMIFLKNFIKITRSVTFKFWIILFRSLRHSNGISQRILVIKWVKERNIRSLHPFFFPLKIDEKCHFILYSEHGQSMLIPKVVRQQMSCNANVCNLTLIFSCPNRWKMCFLKVTLITINTRVKINAYFPLHFFGCT